MRRGELSRLATGAGVGLLVGLLMALVVWDRRLGDWVGSMPVLSASYNIIHVPAWWLAYAALSLHLFEPKDTSFLTVVPVCTAVEWTLAGVLIGLWLCQRRRRDTGPSIIGRSGGAL
jgi:hypothetical protein